MADITPDDNEKVPPPGLRHPNLRTISNPVMKERVTITTYSVESHGAYTATEIIVVQPGGGPPKHFHTRMRETFTAGPKGCGLDLDGKTYILKEGESMVAEPHHVHRFFNHLPADTTGGPSAREISIRSKSEGIDGRGTETLEKSLSIAYGLARDGLVKDDGTPRSLIHVAIVANLGDINLPGLAFWIATPLLKSLYLFAQWSGEEQRLLDKYWYGR